jgi:transcriptional regulator with XRE-family HTH domain
MRQAARLRASFADDLGRLVGDAGVSQRALAEASGLPQPYISRIIRGTARPTLEASARLAAALGADLQLRLYPNTGPAIRDRHQAGILEAVIAERHPRWTPFTEVAVRRPSRGWIDLALHDARESTIVAGEIQSELHRLEQLVRWSAEKAASLPSWDGWDRLGDTPRISQLLVVRRTRTSAAAAREFAGQLRVAYPAHPDDALAALTGTRRWPGAAILWVVNDASGPRLVARA